MRLAPSVPTSGVHVKPHRIPRLIAGGACLVVTGLLALSLPATADQATPSSGGGGGGGGGGSSNGTCSFALDNWTLQGKSQNGRIQVQADVFVSGKGSKWTWTLTDDGVLVGSGKKTADKLQHEHYSFEVRKSFTDRAGVDSIEFRAVATSGEFCDGTLSI
jgi:hypothetical protein